MLCPFFCYGFLITKYIYISSLPILPMCVSHITSCCQMLVFYLNFALYLKNRLAMFGRQSPAVGTVEQYCECAQIMDIRLPRFSVCLNPFIPMIHYLFYHNRVVYQAVMCSTGAPCRFHWCAVLPRHVFFFQASAPAAMHLWVITPKAVHYLVIF